MAESVFSGNLCFRRHGAWLQFAGWTPGVGLRTLSKSRKAWCGISHLNEHSCQPLRRSCALLPDWPKAIVDTREKRAVKTSMQTEQRSISCLQQPFSARHIAPAPATQSCLDAELGELTAEQLAPQSMLFDACAIQAQELPKLCDQKLRLGFRWTLSGRPGAPTNTHRGSTRDDVVVAACVNYAKEPKPRWPTC